MKTTSFNNISLWVDEQKNIRIINASDIFRRKSNFKLSQIACNFVFNLLPFCMRISLHIMNVKINIQMQAAQAFQLFIPNEYHFLFFSSRVRVQQQ